MRLPSILVAALVAPGLIACGAKKDDEDKDSEDGACLTLTSFGLVNGIETAEFKAVGNILSLAGNNQIGSCTGTFVSATTMITAAHCIDGTENGGIYFMPGNKPDPQTILTHGIQAVKAYHLGYTSEELLANESSLTDEMRLSDLAVLVFPPVTAPAVIGVAVEVPAVGERVTLVGYGQRHFEEDGVQDSTVRYAGTNTIAEIPLDPSFLTEQLHFGFITEAESAAGAGEAALTNHGDSGGPMLRADGLAGIFSQGGSYDDNGTTRYFGNANSTLGDRAVELFAAARADGAVIPLPGEAPIDEPLANYDDIEKEQAQTTAGSNPVGSACLTGH